MVWGCFLGSPRPETSRKCKIVKHVVKHVLQRFTTFYNVLQHFTTFYNILQLHRCDGGGAFWSKTAKKSKIFQKKNFLGKFLKMVNWGPGTGQAAGTVFRPKIESQHIEFIFFSKIGVIFQGHP